MEVMVMDTAASLKVSDIRSGTGAWIEVRRQAPSMTKVSSIPIPNIRKGAARLIPEKSCGIAFLFISNTRVQTHETT